MRRKTEFLLLVATPSLLKDARLEIYRSPDFKV
jgi:hypothetical protein